MKFRNPLPTLALTVSLVLSLPALALAETTIRFATGYDLESIDPIWTTAGGAFRHGYMVYDTLLAKDADGLTHPQMLESYDISDDSLTYTFTLREGLLWHDGTPVTAEDCVASIQRWGARDGAGQVLMEYMSAMNTIDDKTFEMVLSEPFGATIDTLAKGAANVPFMMPKRVAETSPDEQITEYVGSGPFIFVEEEWVPGSKIVYRKNPNYVPRDEPASDVAGGKHVHVDRVEWLIMPDQQTALSALMAGEVDILESPTIDMLPIVDQTEGLTTTQVNRDGWVGMVVPNHLHPPFDDPRAHEALAWLIDQEVYLQAIAGNPEYSKPCASLFACGTPMSSDIGGEALSGFDKERARELFEEIGWDFDEPIVLLNADDPAINSSILLTAQALRSIGLTTDVQSMDWSTLAKRRTSTDAPEDGGWNIFITYGSAGSRHNPFFNASYSAACADGWFGWACDEELETLRAAWPLGETVEERQEIARAYQERAFTVGSPWIPFGQWAEPVAHSETVTDFVPIGTGVVVFWNMRKSESAAD